VPTSGVTLNLKPWLQNALLSRGFSEATLKIKSSKTSKIKIKIKIVLSSLIKT
jgi:hypothetical protein